MRIKEIRNYTLHKALQVKRTLCIEEKKIWLTKYLGKQRVPYVDDREVIIINRSNLVQESFDSFSTILDLNLHKELQIIFEGEKAQDAGGVEREWVTQIIQNLLSPEYDLFRVLPGVSETAYYFDPKKEDSNKQLQWYYFMG